MKVWVVCDNNNTAESILVFKTLALARKYVNQYTGVASKDCWLFNEKGTKIISKEIKNETTTTKTRNGN